MDHHPTQSSQFHLPCRQQSILQDFVNGTKLKTYKYMENNKHGIPIPRHLLFIMRMTFFLFIVCVFQAYATDSYAQKTQLSIHENKIELGELLNKIEKQSDFYFFYSNNKINKKQKVTVDVENKTIFEILDIVLADSDITYEVNNKAIILNTTSIANPNNNLQQNKRQISGKVTDENGEPIIGANVVEVGTTNGTVTDIDGKFILEVGSNTTISVTYIGYLEQNIEIKDKLSINVTLKEDTKSLDEIIVIGYGVMKKSDLTGAVASVKGDKISSASSNDITDVLQGKVAGMSIVSSSRVDQSGSIRIRGTRSLNANNDPLVIIDGVPGRLESVNMNDIESVEVLKDAASTAIYGSRGANGVIMVTTKSAGEQKTKISYSGYIGVRVPNRTEMQSGDEYIQFRRDGFRYRNGWEKPFTDEEVFEPGELDVIKSRNFTDWIDLLYRNGQTQSHYVGLSSGSKVTKLHIGLNYSKDEGYSKINYNNRFNLSVNLDHEINKYVKIGLTTRLQNNKYQGMNEFNEMLTYMTPLAIPYNQDGSLNYYPALQNASGYNVLANYDKNEYTNMTVKNAAYLTGFLNIKLSDKLNNRANISYNVVDRKRGYFFGKNSYDRKGRQPLAGKEYITEVDYTFNNIISYDDTWAEHHFVFDGVFEATGYIDERGNMSGENQPVAETLFHNLGTADDNIQIASGYQKWTLASFLGRIRWDYKNKYNASFAIRADGASRLAKGNKWAYFPSGGIAWRISEEEFYKASDWLNSLKVRVSYGAVGNSAISPYQTLAGLSRYDYLFGEEASNKVYTYRPSMIPNGDLGWEITRTTNIGIDFGFLNNRISGYVEGYLANTSNLLMERTLPFFTGFSKVWQNIGKTENKGIELNIQALVMDTKNFNWDATLTFARNWGKITELTGGGDLRNNSWFIGKPLSVYYNYEKIGIWQLGEEEEAKKYNASPGDIKIKDQNKDDAIGEMDKIIIGQRDPKLIASFLNTLQWKGFDASLNLNMAFGHTIQPNTYSHLLTRDGLRWMPSSFNYWTPDNPSNEFTRADKLSGYDPFMGTGGYMKGDYIKVENITIGYDFSRIIPSSWRISRARLYGQVRNLGYLYKACKSDVTPEAPNFDYNIPTTYTMGINIDF